MPVTFKRLDVPEIVLVEPRIFNDDRGFFLESYKHSQFVEFGIPEHFVQTNHSHSGYGVLRGLHYQMHPMAQGKLVMAARGTIFDVGVDIRKGSPTYGHWAGALLSAENHHLLYIPPGFAHGFCVLSPEVDVIYQVTAEYSPAHDRGIIWNDPDIGIAWPINAPLLSTKDLQQPLLRQAENNFSYKPDD
ncbi:MAG: dTDP-4-dehydrorhamnose 3,5-epimerase [Anaerolineae bacterium]|nr:dTDP-4-dehydrorhamnose 3,5-epimerase [Anaerolineae bacterium]